MHVPRSLLADPVEHAGVRTSEEFGVRHVLMAAKVERGMPGAAIKLDAATLVLPSEKIAATLASLAKTRKQ